MINDNYKNMPPADDQHLEKVKSGSEITLIATHGYANHLATQYGMPVLLQAFQNNQGNKLANVPEEDYLQKFQHWLNNTSDWAIRALLPSKPLETIASSN